MLKKLLPKLTQSLQNILKRNPLKRELNQNPQENPSPNLIIPLDTSKPIVKVRSKIVPITNFTVIFVALVFSVFLLVNFFLDARLNKLREIRDALVINIDMRATVYEEAKTLSTLVDLYKNAKEKNVGVTKTVEVIMSSFGEEVILSSFSYKRDKNSYELSVDANRPSSLAYMLNSLLESGLVETITLQSVTLNPRGENYSASLSIQPK